MSLAKQPHILGIDDGPLPKERGAPVAIIGVLMAGAHVVEGVAKTQFTKDGDCATEFLQTWIESLHWGPSLQGIFLGGVTLGGLGIVDICALSESLKLPVMAITRKDTAQHRVLDALLAARLSDRQSILGRIPPCQAVVPGVFASFAGIPSEKGCELIKACLGKSQVPEPLRIAHMIGSAFVQGVSKKRA